MQKWTLWIQLSGRSDFFFKLAVFFYFCCHFCLWWMCFLQQVCEPKTKRSGFWPKGSFSELRLYFHCSESIANFCPAFVCPCKNLHVFWHQRNVKTLISAWWKIDFLLYILYNRLDLCKPRQFHKYGADLKHFCHLVKTTCSVQLSSATDEQSSSSSSSFCCSISVLISFISQDSVQWFVRLIKPKNAIRHLHFCSCCLETPCPPLGATVNISSFLYDARYHRHVNENIIKPKL